MESIRNWCFETISHYWNAASNILGYPNDRQRGLENDSKPLETKLEVDEDLESIESQTSIVSFASSKPSVAYIFPIEIETDCSAVSLAESQICVESITLIAQENRTAIKIIFRKANE